MGARPLVVGIADLRRQPGTRRRFQRGVPLDGLAITSARVPDDAEIGLDLELEALSNGLVATGTLTVPWEGECRRCLRDVRSETVADIREVFEPSPVEGETYPLGDDLVDLEPMVRDAVLLTLPLAPLCDEGCLGPAPDTFPAVVEGDGPEASDDPGGAAAAASRPPTDPRWAALDDLRFDSPGDDG
jgi:uncharacterized protein